MANNPIKTELLARGVAGCAINSAQRATTTSTRATSTATPPATDSVKSLALLVLERNHRRNKGATAAVAPPPVLEGVLLRPSCALEHPPLDNDGLPFEPCHCGCHYFWKPAAGKWRCYDCQPYTDQAQPKTTCTLSRGLKVVSA